MTYTPLPLGACSFSPERGKRCNLDRARSDSSFFTALRSEANDFMLVNVEATGARPMTVEKLCRSRASGALPGYGACARTEGMAVAP